MSGIAPRLLPTDTLSPDQIEAIDALIHAATRADGVPPVREDVRLQVRAGGGGLAVLALDADPGTTPLLGFGHLDTDEHGSVLEIAVHPDARDQGIGAALLDELLRHCPPASAPVRLWAHGQRSPAAGLARSRGFARERQLHQMRRSLGDPLPPVVLPAGITLRTFDPDHDLADLRALNAAAFTALPDQGGWTEADIRARMAEDWFDPEGLLLACSGPELVGFHWTKVATPAEPSAPDHATRHEAVPPDDVLGEVYVLGVHPQARGGGLGRALGLAGLHLLRDQGLPGALLYVEATNVPAVRLYTSLGFSVWDSDTLFRPREDRR